MATKTDVKKTVKTDTQKKVGAGPALAAHSKDGKSTGNSGQAVKPTSKK